MTITLRVDGTPAMGMGHLVRSLALKDGLRHHCSYDCVIVTRTPEFFSAKSVLALPPSILDVEEGFWIAQEIPSSRVVITDLYRPCQEQIKNYRQGPWALICLDDENDVFFDCDLLVNPNLNQTFRHRFSGTTLYRTGKEAILLREQFDTLPVHPCRQEIRHVLVCFGGSDPWNMSKKVCAWLQDTMPDRVERVSVVVGRGFDGNDGIPGLPKRGKWRLLKDVAHMATLMQEADVGILAAGTLLYEAAAAGLPALFISMTEAQVREAEFACQAGTAINLGQYKDVTAPTIGSALACLGEHQTRKALSQAGQALIDGGGRRRLIESIIELYTKGRGGR
jgi:spore coat polysaccharide biosynthesis predicted glycosyltransferase SpsG